MIEGLSNSGSIPVLERVAQFAGARHRLIAHNIANLSTPEYRPVDLSVTAFQQQLSSAVDRRREEHPAGNGALIVEPTDQVRFDRHGVAITPGELNQNILFHDGNDRDLERTFQAMTENFMVFRQAMEVLRNRYQLLNTAIRERL